ncbi:lipase family protein [Actinokineospora sp. NPDC004072]
MPVLTFDQTATGYSLRQAYWMAEAARLAYKGQEEIERTAREWGFDRVRHHETAFRPPFPLEDTQAYVAASDRMILVGFRGTEPKKIQDWLSDASTPPWPGPAGNGYVHYGFAEALKSIYPKVRDNVIEWRDNDQTIWFTGHSLGGALAALAALHLYFEDPRLLADGVYTFGQPRVCDAGLAEAHDTAFEGRTHRFVNNSDIVPLVPPAPAFHHTKSLHHIDANGRVRDTMPVVNALFDRAKGMTSDPFAPASDGIRDHYINNYINALKPLAQ